VSSKVVDEWCSSPLGIVDNNAKPKCFGRPCQILALQGLRSGTGGQVSITDLDSAPDRQSRAVTMLNLGPPRYTLHSYHPSAFFHNSLTFF
jgi:hypothetical protein